MTDNTVALLIYCAIGVLVIMLAISFNLIRMVRELEKKVHYISDENEQHYKAELQLQSYFNKIDISINQMRGSLEVLTASAGGELHDIQRQLSRIEAGISRLQCAVAVNGNRLHDIVDWTGMDHETEDKDHADTDTVSCLEYWADKATLADIVDPANCEVTVKEEEKNEDAEQNPVSYRWIFPSDNQRVQQESERPVMGQWYLVVGTIKGLTHEDGITPLTFSDEGLFNGTDFITRTDQRFDRVYAYIKQPSSSDIMEKVFSLAIKAKG